MSKIKKPEKSSELPLPDKGPEIRPDLPNEPLASEPGPEIRPEVEPEEPKYE